MTWAIGVDIGGTKTSIGCVDADGFVMNRTSMPTDVAAGPEGIIQQIIASIKDIAYQRSRPPVGIGVGMAGQIDSANGTVFFAPNLHWINVPLQTQLNKALGLPVKVINDVRAATIAEWYYGTGRVSEDFVCLFIGTGIGSGIVSGGRLLEGHNNSAGEFGHMTINYNGPKCSCGSTGCLQTYAGGLGIAQRAQQKIFADPSLGKDFSDPAQLTAKDIVAAYRKGNVLAEQVIHEARRALVFGAKNIVNALNPQLLILGGGVFRGLPEIRDWIEVGVREQALKSATEQLQVLPSKLMEDAGIVGAATLILNE